MAYIRAPFESYHRQSETRVGWVLSARKCISRAVVGSLFVHDFVTKLQKFGERLLLPHSVQSLVVEVHKSLLVGVNLKFSKLQI